MELEQVIEVAGKHLATGRNIEEIVTEFVDMDMCSSEQAVQLREHFAPPAVPDNVLPVPSDATLCEPIPQSRLLEQSVPVLQIDWGMDIRPNIILSPIFTIQGGTFRGPPRIYFPIDSRIAQNGWSWDTMPLPRQTPNGWRFSQNLQLEKVGQYLFEIVVIDSQPGFADPGYYHATFRMDVTDPHGGQRRKVTIHAEGNLTGLLDKFGKDADIEIRSNGNMVLNARDESVMDKLVTVHKNTEPDSEIMTIPFLSDVGVARKIPYISEVAPKPVHRLIMTESGTKRYVLIGGRRLVFGRNDPDKNIWNDVPLEVVPGTLDEQSHANEFVILNNLFSRKHAHLEVCHEGVDLLDDRQGGIRDATILDRQTLPRGGGVPLFSDDTESPPHTVLFSKMLAIQLTPFYETVLNETVLSRTFMNNLPASFSQEWLKTFYSLDSFTGPSSIGIKLERYYRQKNHAEALLNILKSMPLSVSLAESEWWQTWFSNANNINPHHGVYEYWFVPRFVTLGQNKRNPFRLESRQWSDVQLRIMCVNHSLYVENISLDTAVEYGIGGEYCPLRSFRPVPLCSGFFVRKGDAVLRFE